MRRTARRGQASDQGLNGFRRAQAGQAHHSYCSAPSRRSGCKNRIRGQGLVPPIAPLAAAVIKR
jgi:hypothetical protein